MVFFTWIKSLLGFTEENEPGSKGKQTARAPRSLDYNPTVDGGSVGEPVGNLTPPLPVVTFEYKPSLDQDSDDLSDGETKPTSLKKKAGLSKLSSSPAGEDHLTDSDDPGSDDSAKTPTPPKKTAGSSQKASNSGSSSSSGSGSSSSSSSGSSTDESGLTKEGDDDSDSEFKVGTSLIDLTHGSNSSDESDTSSDESDQESKVPKRKRGDNEASPAAKKVKLQGDKK